MAIKYPALISAVIPASAWAAGDGLASPVVAGRGRIRARAGGRRSAPGWRKNVIDTGNPVYPLGYAVFGGRHWNPDRDANGRPPTAPRPIEVGRLRPVGRWKSPADPTGNRRSTSPWPRWPCSSGSTPEVG